MAYNEFAYFYDSLNEDADYDALYRHIKTELENHGIQSGIQSLSARFLCRVLLARATKHPGQGQLRGSIVKARKSQPYEPDRPRQRLRAQQTTADVKQRLRGGYGLRQGLRAGNLLKIGKLNFKRHRASSDALRPQRGPYPLGMRHERPFQKASVTGIVGKGGFRAFAFGLMHRRHLPGIPPESPFMQFQPPLAEMGLQAFLTHAAQLLHPDNPQLAQLLRHTLADARQPANRQGAQEGIQSFRTQNIHAVRFVDVGTNLGKKLDGSHADRTGQAAGRSAHIRLETRHQPVHITKKALRSGDIQIRLVDACLLHQRRKRVQHIHDSAGKLRVTLPPPRQKNAVRTELARHDNGHGRMHAETPRLIGSRGDNAPLAAAAHNDRPAAQRRIVQLLHRCKKRIHVQMHNHRIFTETRNA